MNAANEVAVAAFLDGRIGFTDIAGVVEQTLERSNTRVGDAVGDDDAVYWALAVDAAARRDAAQVLSRFERMAAL